MTAPLAFRSVTRIVSLFSGVTSPRMRTSIVFAVSPGAKVIVHVAAS
jgi:hypothetical protein